MSATTKTRKRRLRQTKAQLIDELEALERRLAEPGNGGDRLRDVVENIPEGFSYYDADDRMVICNSVFRTYFGYSDEEAGPGVSYGDLTALDVARSSVASDDYVPHGANAGWRRREYRHRHHRAQAGRGGAS
jgi:PAS domain-containing protein